MSRDISSDSGRPQATPSTSRNTPNNHLAGEGVGSRSSFEHFNIEEYRESLKQKAEHLITKGFPKKIAKLNEVLATSHLQIRDIPNFHQELNLPVPPTADGDFTNEPNVKRKRRNSTQEESDFYVQQSIQNVLCNKPLRELIDLIKPYIWELMEDSNLLKMWIALMIPKTEDGNNFGVSIQLGTLDFVQSVESKTSAYLERISSYYFRRANMHSKATKYPHIDDYRGAVRELDEQTYVALWRMMREICNLYCLVHDNVIKNLEKIKKPRTVHSESLY